MARGAYITESKFNSVKMFQSNGYRQADVAKATGLSRATVSRIYKHRTFKDFAGRNRKNTASTAPRKDAIATVADKPKPTQEAKADKPVQEVTISANRYVMEELRKQTDLLTTISKKMMYMMELMEKGVQTDID